ncbi:MAG TPA: mechanosensitive ion channel domain-containing protein [Longimicrobiales bacterium]|nr:mechanosensitive ion channel domain-containing protein [Longimicrobiales bacterium]
MPEGLTEPIVESALLVLAVIGIRLVTARLIRSNIETPELRQRWLVHTRNILILLLLLGLLLMWADRLQALALSLVAVAIAFVVATKELILCLTGTVLKATARSFSIGDRIQVRDFRGDVIDQNMLTTTILEIGPGKLTHQRTGRIVVLPNSIFVTEPVINESYTDDYVLHVFTVPFRRDDDWRSAQKALLAAATRICGPYLDDVRRHMNRISERRGLGPPSVEPRVTISTPAAGEVHLIVRLPAKSGERGAVEQAVLSEVFATSNYVTGRISDEPTSAPADTGGSTPVGRIGGVGVTGGGGAPGPGGEGGPG